MGKDSNILSSVILHAHPIIELQIKNFRKDGVGFIANCEIFNYHLNEMESDFFLTEDVAQEIIDMMQGFIDNCKENYKAS